MDLLYPLAVVGHVLAAVILAGSTVMMALVVVPAIGRGRLSADAVRSIGQGFAILTAVSGTAVFLTGIYLTSIRYTLWALLTTGSGWLVLASIGSWILLAALLAVGTNRLARHVAVDEPQEGAARSRRWYELALAVAVVGVVTGATV